MRFSVRDLMWLTVVVAVCCCWFKYANNFVLMRDRVTHWEHIAANEELHSRRAEATISVLGSEVVKLRKQRAKCKK